MRVSTQKVSKIESLPAVFIWLEEADVQLEKHFKLLAILFAALFFFSAVVKDIRSPMWTDELFTLYMSEQSSAAQIIRATLDGADGAPPLYAMIVHVIHPVIKNDALAVRMPSSLGYGAMVLCLALFCRRRLSASYSLAAGVLAGLACIDYSTEGRGYGLVLGCAAVALLLWQEAVDGRRRFIAIPLFGFCLGLMTAMHFYSMFFVIPFFLAELVRWRDSRKLDLAVLAAMVAVPLVLAVHYPLIAMSAVFQKHYWSPATWREIPEFYSTYFAPVLLKCVPSVLVLAVLATTMNDRETSETGLTVPEWIVTGMFAVMPFFVVVLAKYTTHVFVLRYVLWAVPGFVALVVALLYRIANSRVAVGLSLVAFVAAFACLVQAKHLSERPALRLGEAFRQQLAALPDGPEPILVARVHVFMELSYYGSPELKRRIIFPISRNLELHYMGSDTNAILLDAMSRRAKLNVLDYDALTAAHPHLIVAAAPDDYMLVHLEEKYCVRPLVDAPVPLLYEATLRN